MLLVGLMAVVGCEAKVAEALEDFSYDKSKVVVSVEGSYEEKDMDDVKLIGLTLGTSIGGNITIQTNDLVLKSALVKLGYEVSEYTTPYVLLGMANISFSQDYAGAISWGSGSAGTTLLRQDYDEMGLAYGIGLEGDLLQYEGVVIGYDLRWLRTSGEESDEYIKLIPDLTSKLAAQNNVEATYNEVDVTILASKEIPLDKEATETEAAKEGIVDSITPFVGYRASLVTLNLESRVGIGPIGLSNEANYQAVSHNAVAGFKAQVNDDVVVKVAGVFGNDLGGSVAVAYQF
jgi:opacity protein-like surface antigen